MIEVHWHGFRMFRRSHEGEPLHDAALDGMRQVVDGVCPVGQAEVNDCGSLSVIAPIAPEEIGGMQIVVRPKRFQRRQERKQLCVERRQKFESPREVPMRIGVSGQSWPGGDVMFEHDLRVGGCKN